MVSVIGQRRGGFLENRPLDSLYDTTYFHSEISHCRTSDNSTLLPSTLKPQPNFQNMFSDLIRYPRLGYTLAASGVLGRPKSVQCTGFRPRREPKCDVSGQDRCKFFARSPHQTSKLDSIYTTTAIDWEYNSARGSSPPGGGTRTVMVQTDFRESEAQTDPYSPPYVMSAGCQSELLALAGLSYKHGLPVDFSEIEMIERMRQKRKWEASLPPCGSPAEVEQRRRMMIQQEQEEWAYRERQIERLQKTQMVLLTQFLQQEDDRVVERTYTNLKARCAKLEKNKENTENKIARRLSRDLARLQRKYEMNGIRRLHNHLPGLNSNTLSRYGIVVPHRSRCWSSAPIAKEVAMEDVISGLSESPFLVDLQTPLWTKEQSLEGTPVSKKGYVKRRYKYRHMLEELASREQPNQNPTPRLSSAGALIQTPLVKQILKPPPKPPTPVLTASSLEEDNRVLAVVTLQKTLRGRCVQKKILAGLQLRADLISETRRTHALQDLEKHAIEQWKIKTIQAQKEELHKREQLAEAAAPMENISAAAAADILDFLSKELVRLQDERRLHALMVLAERRRRIREAEESGRRQLELQRRAEEDAIFRTVVKVCQETVDSYLEDIITSSAQDLAEEQAKLFVAKKADAIAVSMETMTRLTDQASEDLIAELVYGYVIPEVDRCMMREKAKQTEHTKLLAAHKVVWGELTNTEDRLANSSQSNTCGPGDPS